MHPSLSISLSWVLRALSLPRRFCDRAHVPYMISAVGILALPSRPYLSSSYDTSQAHYLWAPGVECVMDKASAASDRLYSGLLHCSLAV